MALIVLSAFFALVFAPTLIAGRIILIGDPLKQFYPIRTVVWQMIRAGHLPSWLPNILSGYPSMSMVMLGLGYPLTWGYLFLPGQWAEQIYELAPYFLAPIFTYAFLREWKRSRTASVLGGLTFGYGGFLFSPIGLTGVHANSALWLPLFLLGIARARRRPFTGAFLIATGAYTMSVLAGSGQIFLYAGALALAYAIFLAIWPNRDESATAPNRWQPLAVAIGVIVFSVGLTAFQTVETWTAINQSVRDTYPPERVAEGSFTGAFALRSLLQPLGNYWDSSTFVPLVALFLAIFAVFAMRRRGGSHIYFWIFIAAISWLLILGSHTPLFDLYVRVPFVKMFRYPSRHTMEWTFAIAVLAAYGWDILEELSAKRLAQNASARDGRRSSPLIAAAIVVAAAAAFLALQWLRYTQRVHLDDIPDLNRVITQLDLRYLAFKIGFTLCIAVAVALLIRLRAGTLRQALLMSIVALACLGEPYVWMVGPVIEKWSPSRALFDSFGDSTQFLRKQLRPGQRTFSLPHPYSVETEPVRDVDAVNWTALAGMEDGNGYESLILSRYSRAFEGVVDHDPFVTPDPRLLAIDSPLLDLLSIGYVICYRDFNAVRRDNIEKYGIAFSPIDLGVDIPRDQPFSVSASGAEADTLGVVTTLGMAGAVDQGAPVARITVHATNGRVVERDLLAGIHTSEMSFDRPDVKSGVHHHLAPVFDDTPGEPGYANHRYFAKIDLGERLPVSRVEFVKTAAVPDAGLGVWKVSLFDSRTGKSSPLPQPPPERWQTIYDHNDVMIYKNLHPLPRAWLVGQVGTLDESELLRLIRGESQIKFDPRATAFVDSAGGRQTLTAAQTFASTAVDTPLAGGVRIVRQDPSRLMFDVTSSHQAMLVVSEIFYPGWVATIDGQAAQIHRTDFLLRGVFVPAGHHTIEMSYGAPGAKKGGLVSLATLFMMVLLVARSRMAKLR